MENVERKNKYTLWIVLIVLAVIIVLSAIVFLLFVSDSFGDGEGTEEEISDRDYRDMAIDERDESICSEIREESIRNDCYFGVSTRLEESEICDKINSSETKELCLSRVEDDSSTCEDHEEESKRDNCYFGFAMREADESFCEEIVDEEMKSNCNELLE